MKTVLLLFLFLNACSSSEEFEEEEDINQAHYAAYAADGFTYYTPAPKREKRPLIFYHKSCSLLDEPAYFSATSFECEDRNR